MPNRDKTGPNGQGAATGRGMGGCRSTESENNMQERGLGRGLGLGRGFRRGRANRGRRN